MKKLSNDNKVDDSFGTVVLEQDPQTKEPPQYQVCLLYTSPSPRDKRQSRMPSSA